MKTTTSLMIFGCLVLLMDGNCFAADGAETKATTTNNELVAALGEHRNNDQLRAWVTSIKPAAGHLNAVHSETGYWDRSVRRENRRQNQE